MRPLLATFIVLGGLTTAALADDTEKKADESQTEVTQTDCTTLTGDEKTKCEAAAAEAAQPAPEKKGKALKKSDDNRMEADVEDE